MESIGAIYVKCSALRSPYAGNLEIHGTITAQSGECPTDATEERA